MPGELGIQNLVDALSHRTRSVLQGNWQVGAGATATIIPVTLRNPAGTAVDVTGQVAAELAGATIEFTSGANVGKSRNVTAATSAGTLTLDTALPAAPAMGDQFVLLRAVRLEVTAPENLTQVGGQNVPVVNGVPAVPTYSQGSAALQPTDLQTIYRVQMFVTNATLAAGATFDSTALSGSGYNTINFAKVSGKVFANVPGSLQLYESDGGTTWDAAGPAIPVLGGVAVEWSWSCASAYFKLVYTNGATAQTTFRLSGYASVQP